MEDTVYSRWMFVVGLLTCIALVVSGTVANGGKQEKDSLGQGAATCTAVGSATVKPVGSEWVRAKVAVPTRAERRPSVDADIEDVDDLKAPGKNRARPILLRDRTHKPATSLEIS